MDFQTVLNTRLAMLEDLTDVEVDAIRAAQSSEAVRLGSQFARDFASGRRVLATGGHGAELKAADEAVRAARPDLPHDVRIAFRWAVLADAFRDQLTDGQHAALTRAWAAAEGATSMPTAPAPARDGLGVAT